MNSSGSTVRFDTTKRPLQPFQPARVQIGTPYNTRLPSSTPCETPTKEINTRPGDELRGIIKPPTRILMQSQALNSSDQIRGVMPPPPPPGPALSQGLVQFRAHPPTGTVNISNHGSSKVDTGPYHYSLYTDSDTSHAGVQPTNPHVPLGGSVLAPGRYATDVAEQTRFTRSALEADRYRAPVNDELRRTFPSYGQQPAVDVSARSVRDSQVTHIPHEAAGDVMCSMPEAGTQTSVTEPPRVRPLVSRVMCPAVGIVRTVQTPSTHPVTHPPAASPNTDISLYPTLNQNLCQEPLPNQRQRNKKVQFNGKTNKKSVVKPKKKVFGTKQSSIKTVKVSGTDSHEAPVGELPLLSPGAPPPQPPAKVASPQAKSHLQRLKYLLKELKTVAGLNHDVEVRVNKSQ